MHSNRNIIILLLSLMMMSSYLFVISRNVPSPFGSLWYFYAPIWFIALFILRPYVYHQRYIQIVLIISLIVVFVLTNILWYNLSAHYTDKIFFEFYSFSILILIVGYFVLDEDYEGWAYISKLALVFIVITGIMTIIATLIEPTVARNSANSFIYDPHQKALFILTGCGGYGYGQALSLIFPPLVYLLKLDNQEVFSKKKIIALIIFLFIVIVQMQYFANILLAVFSIGISLLGAKRKKITIIFFLIFTIIIYFIPISFYSELFRDTSRLFDPNSEIYFKLNDAASFILNPDISMNITGTAERLDRYPMLLEAFLANPILGDGSYNSRFSEAVSVGGHLHWMSMLTSIGLVGFFVYLFVLKTVFRLIYEIIDDQFVFYYSISIITLILSGLFKNFHGIEIWLTIIIVIPGINHLAVLATKNNELS